jgi:DNA-binding transcriptional LysR family regulator
MVASLVTGTLPNLAAFCRTYETGSFTKAARVLGVTPQAVSRGVMRLEDAVGITLFRRTTRSLAPTEAAQRYYTLCVQALGLLSAGERELSVAKHGPEGLVRMSVPTTYGHHRLLPSLSAFRERYPLVRLELHVSNQNIDFVRDGFDLAIRMGRIEDQSLVARKLGDFPAGVYGSPSYLARNGTPRTPEDLSKHDCIGFVMPSSGRILPWSFVPGPRSLTPRAAYRCSDDVLGSITMARAGLGLVQAYDFLVEADVARGSLVEVLQGYRGLTRAFSLVYPKAVKPGGAVRALIDFVVTTAKTRTPG